MERTKSGSSVKDVYHFIYDEMGNIWEAVCYIGGSTTPVRYFYRTNAQGDVKQIVDSNYNYNVVAYYSYDAWGKLLAVLDGNDNPITDSSHFAIVNPFRYRGYVYDTETGFYYLQSRYYDPEIGRFINADGQLNQQDGVSGHNLFAYCGINPVNNSDPDGNEAILALNTMLIGVTFLITWAMSKAPIPVRIPYCPRNQSFEPDGAIARAKKSKPSDGLAKIDEKEAVDFANRSRNGSVYYHVTTLETAEINAKTNMMMGSSAGGSFVYAWKLPPDKYAMKNVGAHGNCLISFRTNAAFESDPEIEDLRVKMYAPVRTVFPGSIVVWDVKIVKVE